MITSKRNGTVDIFRLLAAFGVICIHVPFNTIAAGNINTVFSPLCVPFFYAVSLTYFISGLKEDLSIGDVFKKMGYRILLPYLAWTVVYVALMVLKSRLIGLQHATGGQFVFWRMLFYGEGAVQLYYLPELIALQATALSIYLIFYCSYKKKVIGFVVLTFVVLYYILGSVINAFGVTPLQCIIFYLAVGFLFSKSTRNTTTNYYYIIGGVALTLFALSGIYFNDYFYLFKYTNKLPLCGLGLLLITFGLPIYTMPKWPFKLCSTSYGVYLSHIVFLEGFAVIIKKLFHINLYYDFSIKLIMVSMIFIAAIILTFLLRKTTLTKRLFLGE